MVSGAEWLADTLRKGSDFFLLRCFCECFFCAGVHIYIYIRLSAGLCAQGGGVVCATFPRLVRAGRVFFFSARRRACPRRAEPAGGCAGAARGGQKKKRGGAVRAQPQKRSHRQARGGCARSLAVCLIYIYMYVRAKKSLAKNTSLSKKIATFAQGVR